MKKNNLTWWTLAIFALSYSASCSEVQEMSSDENTKINMTPEKVIERGKYLVTTMGCTDCHSPKKNGSNGPEVIPELMLSGYPSDRPIIKFVDPMIKEGFVMFYPDLTAAAGPWGVSFAANLTPDESGIGNWSEEQFKKALTQGKYKGMDNERMLLPPMPWPNFENLTNEDVNAIFMYLKNIKPVKNIVPQPLTPDKMQ